MISGRGIAWPLGCMRDSLQNRMDGMADRADSSSGDDQPSTAEVGSMKLWALTWRNGDRPLIGERGSGEQDQVSLRPVPLDQLSAGLAETLRFVYGLTPVREASMGAHDAGAGRDEADERSSDIEVSEAWGRLGRQLGFIGLRDDLAVILIGHGADLWQHREVANPEDVVGRVAELLTRLRKAGREHSAIAIVGGPQVLPQAADIFRAGGYFVQVGDDFQERGWEQRLGLLRSMFPPDTTADRAAPDLWQDPEPEIGAYVGVNPDLDEDDVAAWKRQLMSASSDD